MNLGFLVSFAIAMFTVSIKTEDMLIHALLKNALHLPMPDKTNRLCKHTFIQLLPNWVSFYQFEPPSSHRWVSKFQVPTSTQMFISYINISSATKASGLRY